MIHNNEINDLAIVEFKGNMTIKLLTVDDGLDDVNERLEGHGDDVLSLQSSWLPMSS